MAVDKSGKMIMWLRRYGADCVMLCIVLAMLVWVGIIASWKDVDAVGLNTNKSGWLIIPLTAIYVITNIYIAAGGLRSAHANEKSVSALQETVNIMRLQTNALYNPTIVHPEGYKCWLKNDGRMEIILANLHNQPALDLGVDLWEMEVGSDGKKVCKTSSLRRSIPTTFFGDIKNQVFSLHSSKDTDIEKAKRSEIALSRYREVFNKEPESALCAVHYYTKTSGGGLLVYDLEVIQPTP